MNEKTLDGFKHYSSITGNTDVTAYLSKNDTASPDLIEYLKGSLPLITESKYCLQLGEPLDYSYTLDRRLEPLYMTFSNFQGVSRYCGCCLKNETIDQSWR